MNEQQALGAFGALSQETRLRIVRMLVVAGSSGMPAGAIAAAVEVSPSSASFHLKELERVGLAFAKREARSIVYTANYEALGGLVRFLMDDCCGGHPEICAPTLSAACCTPEPQDKLQ